MNSHPGIFLTLFSRLMKLFDTKVIAVSNQKGGVGKTTSAVNIAAYLAVTETPTLLIDMDPQANATSGVGIEVGSYKKSIYDIIIGKLVSEYDFNSGVFVKSSEPIFIAGTSNSNRKSRSDLF